MMPPNVSMPSKPVCHASTTSAVGAPASIASEPAGRGGLRCSSAPSRSGAGRVALGDPGERAGPLLRARPGALREDHRGRVVAHVLGELPQGGELGARVGRAAVDEVVAHAVARDVEARVGEQLALDDEPDVMVGGPDHDPRRDERVGEAGVPGEDHRRRGIERLDPFDLHTQARRETERAEQARRPPPLRGGHAIHVVRAARHPDPEEPHERGALEPRPAEREEQEPRAGESAVIGEEVDDQRDRQPDRQEDEQQHGAEHDRRDRDEPPAELRHAEASTSSSQVPSGSSTIAMRTPGAKSIAGIGTAQPAASTRASAASRSSTHTER